MSTEPSQRAKDISKEICDSYNASLPLRGLAIVIQAALDAERAELEAQLAALTERVVRKDLPTAFTIAFGKMKAMAALLDRVPHHLACGQMSGTVKSLCLPDCPACAWARLKGLQ